jgi:phosphoribosylformylglycinamidine synthase
MAMASEMGLDLDLDLLDAEENLSGLTRLFSESTGRMVVTVNPAKKLEFEALLKDVSFAEVGVVTKSDRLSIKGLGRSLVELTVEGMRQSFNKRFGGLV